MTVILMPQMNSLETQKSNCRSMLEPFIVGAKQNLLKHGHVSPVFFLHVSGGIRPVIPDFRDNQSKDFSVRQILSMLKSENSDFFVHISEAWMITRPPGSDPDELPSKAKDRKSCILLVYNQRDGRRVSIQIPFQCGKGGKPSYGKIHEFYTGFSDGNDGDDSGGRFADLSTW